MDMIARGLAVQARTALNGKTLIGEKLRRAAARASSPWNTLPLIDTPAYANNATLMIGQAVKANGNIYLCRVAGTTAATGTGPSANFGDIVDGTVTFAYYSTAPANYTDSTAPTVTTTTTAPAGLTNIFSPESVGAASSYVPGCMRPLGGYITYDGSNRNQLITFNRSPSGTDLVSNYTGWDFETDAPSVAIRFTTLALVRTIGVEIDGKLLQMGGVALPGGGQAWLKLDFPAGERQFRTIRIWHGQAGDVRARDVYVSGRDTVRSPTRELVRAAFIGDSIFNGSNFGPMLPGGSMQQRISAALGWDDPWSFTTGGTGFLNDATGAGGPYRTYEQRVAEAVTRSPDVWVLFGSTNDGSYTSAQRQAAALSCLRTIRASSAAPIFHMGVWSVNSSTPAIEADMLAAFTAFKDPLSAFIPVSSPAGLPWVTGTWNNTSHSAASTAYTIGGDGIHPYDSGTALGARQAVSGIRAGMTF